MEHEDRAKRHFAEELATLKQQLLVMGGWPRNVSAWPFGGWSSVIRT